MSVFFVLSKHLASNIGSTIIKSQGDSQRNLMEVYHVLDTGMLMDAMMMGIYQW